MIVMPSAPVVLSGTFFFKGEVVQHPSDVGLSISNHSVQEFVRICFHLRSSVLVNLKSEH